MRSHILAHVALSLTGQILLAVLAWLILVWIGNTALTVAVSVGCCVFTAVYRHR